MADTKEAPPAAATRWIKESSCTPGILSDPSCCPTVVVELIQNMFFYSTSSFRSFVLLFLLLLLYYNIYSKIVTCTSSRVNVSKYLSIYLSMKPTTRVRKLISFKFVNFQVFLFLLLPSLPRIYHQTYDRLKRLPMNLFTSFVTFFRIFRFFTSMYSTFSLDLFQHYK